MRIENIFDRIEKAWKRCKAKAIHEIMNEIEYFLLFKCPITERENFIHSVCYHFTKNHDELLDYEKPKDTSIFELALPKDNTVESKMESKFVQYAVEMYFVLDVFYLEIILLSKFYNVDKTAYSERIQYILDNWLGRGEFYDELWTSQNPSKLQQTQSVIILPAITQMLEQVGCITQNPLQWLKSKSLLAYFVVGMCEKYKFKHGQKRMIKPFENMFNVHGLTGAINDIKKVSTPPADYEIINDILKLPENFFDDNFLNDK
jgi:hypothetical protein